LVREKEMNEIALTIKGLSFRYSDHGQNAIDDISLEIPKGKIVAILGPNGAGKTTLLHLLLGYRQPISGQVLIFNKPHPFYSRRELGQLIGVVPQWEPALFNFTVLEYVLLGRAPYLDPLQMPTQADFRIAQSSLEKLGITHLMDRPISGLSGGEWQIVLVARALAQRTEILLLDEPTSHLDLSNQSTILGVLDELSYLGKSVVFTTHDPNIATHTADDILLMRQGQIYAYGSIEDVLTEESLAAIYQTTIIVEKVRGQTVILMEKNRK
jgi:iron complex transport system ATP-binding protein